MTQYPHKKIEIIEHGTNEIHLVITLITHEAHSSSDISRLTFKETVTLYKMLRKFLNAKRRES